MSDEAEHIPCGSLSRIHHETAVFLRYLSASNGISAKARVLYELSGEVAGRPLESAAGARKIKRLLRCSPLSQIVHEHFYLFRFPVV